MRGTPTDFSGNAGSHPCGAAQRRGSGREPGEQKVVRFIPDGDLKVLDPIFTTAGTTASHGFMVYDMLFAQDSKFQPRPQMVQAWETTPEHSPGRSTFVMALRSATGRLCAAKIARPH